MIEVQDLYDNESQSTYLNFGFWFALGIEIIEQNSYFILPCYILYFLIEHT